MASSRSSRRRTVAPVFPTLSEGVQNGLTRLVSDNFTTVAKMLDTSTTTTTTTTTCEDLTELCAKVMKQQQLSVVQFLARFFHADLLSRHMALYYNSAKKKGTSAQLGERIGKEWAKNSPRINTTATTAAADTADSEISSSSSPPPDPVRNTCLSKTKPKSDAKSGPGDTAPEALEEDDTTSRHGTRDNDTKRKLGSNCTSIGGIADGESLIKFDEARQKSKKHKRK